MQTDLSTITDTTELNALYVKHNEAFLAASQQAEVEQQNVLAIRTRLLQLGSESAPLES